VLSVLLLAAMGVAMFLLWHFLPRGPSRLTSPGDRIGGKAAPTGSRVLLFQVGQLESKAGGTLSVVGRIGEELFEVHPGDRLAVNAQLSSHAYCSLLRFDPSRQDPKWDPENVSLLSSSASLLRFPAADSTFYAVEETGLHAFALLVSSNAMRDHRKLMEGASRSPWHAGLPGQSGVVWRSDGIRLSRSPARGEPERDAEGMIVSRLASWLRQLPEVDAVEVIAFPVLPADGRQKSP
jgi:hypothetical protein